MLLQVILEGLGLGVLLVLICAAGIRKGAVGMVHLYSPAVQQRCVKLGLTTHEKIKRNSLLFKAVCVPGYISYVLVCVYGINGARSFAAGFWQLLVILSVMNLIDRFLIDGYWVGHTNAWTIPGTEDLKPYITAKDKQKKWIFGTVGMAAIAAALPGKNVLFAFALSAGHREVDRVVSIDLKKITIGQLPGAISNKQLIGRIFHGTKYKVVYEPNMEDYLLCHAAFVMPAAFACYKTDGDLKKLRGDTAYLNRVLDANIEGYRAIRDAGHAILPKEDADFEGEKYRKTCLRFFKLMCATSLGKLCASDHAMNAIDEMSALNRDLKKFFDEHGAAYPVWQALETEAGRYLQ